MNLIRVVFPLIFLCACAAYKSPPRETWGDYLRGASFIDMTENARVAKRPVFLGAGGHLVTNDKIVEKMSKGMTDVSDNAIAMRYMANLEYELYDSLRKPGISVQRAGTDVVVILVRDAFMELDAPEISATGADTLKTIARILRKYDATFIEIAGYTDQMRDANAARAMSLDMAQRTAVVMGRNKVSTARMFIVGRGAARPIAAQDDIGRLMNRRVEIRLAPAR